MPLSIRGNLFSLVLFGGSAQCAMRSVTCEMVPPGILIVEAQPRENLALFLELIGPSSRSGAVQALRCSNDDERT